MYKKKILNKAEEENVYEKVIKINRVNKVVKGGKRLAFRAFVISGDQKGNVGIGLGKAKEVPSAIKKGMDRAKKDYICVNIVNGTLPHKIVGRFGSSRVVLLPARPGTGVIAGGSVRILLEAAGYKNVVAKSLGSENTINAARAAINGLINCKNLEKEEQRRGKKLPVYIKKEVAEEKVTTTAKTSAIKTENSIKTAPKKAVRTKEKVAAQEPSSDKPQATTKSEAETPTKTEKKDTTTTKVATEQTAVKADTAKEQKASPKAKTSETKSPPASKTETKNESPKVAPAKEEKSTPVATQEKKETPAN
jgi:small subunit ribosomal protein S5